MHTKTTFRFLLAALLISFAFLLTACGDSQSNGQSQAASESASTDEASNGGDEKTFRVAWSIYVGWMPWAYAEQSGILDKWAERYGIKIELVQINDYITRSLEKCLGFSWFREV